MSYITTKCEINEEEYNKLVAIENTDKKSFHEMIEEIAYKKGFYPNAYGCYLPMKVYKEDERFFASWNRWDSCD